MRASPSCWVDSRSHAQHEKKLQSRKLVAVPASTGGTTEPAALDTTVVRNLSKTWRATRLLTPLSSDAHGAMLSSQLSGTFGTQWKGGRTMHCGRSSNPSARRGSSQAKRCTCCSITTRTGLRGCAGRRSVNNTTTIPPARSVSPNRRAALPNRQQVSTASAVDFGYVACALRRCGLAAELVESTTFEEHEMMCKFFVLPKAHKASSFLQARKGDKFTRTLLTKSPRSPRATSWIRSVSCVGKWRWRS